MGEDLRDRRPLRPRAPQEGPSGGDVVEEAVHDDGGSFRVRGGGDLGLRAALDGDARAAPFAGRGGEAEGRDARYGGQSLAPEAKGGYGLDVFDGPDLARRVAQDREAGVLGQHTPALLAHPEAGGPPVV